MGASLQVFISKLKPVFQPHPGQVSLGPYMFVVLSLELGAALIPQGELWFFFKSNLLFLLNPKSQPQTVRCCPSFKGALVGKTYKDNIELKESEYIIIFHMCGSGQNMYPQKIEFFTEGKRTQISENLEQTLKLFVRLMTSCFPEDSGPGEGKFSLGGDERPFWDEADTLWAQILHFI